MLNTTYTEFSVVEVWFTDHNSKQLEIEDNVNMTQIIGELLWKWDIQLKQNIENTSKVFLPFARKFGDKYRKKLIDTATKTEINAAKTASERVVQKTAEATRHLIGNKITDKITSIGKIKSKEKADETEI